MLSQLQSIKPIFGSNKQTYKVIGLLIKDIRFSFENEKFEGEICLSKRIILFWLLHTIGMDKK